MFAPLMGKHFLYHSFDEFFSIRLPHGLMHVQLMSPTVDVIANGSSAILSLDVQLNTIL